MFHALRIMLFTLLMLATLSACAPRNQIQDNVVPVLYSVTPAKQVGDTVVLQGRYFGDGQGGKAGDSYVILGANIDAKGGVRISPTSWRPSRISFAMPAGVGYGYVFVVVNGNLSSGLPANLP